MRRPVETRLEQSRRRLPHFAREETAQFVTFRLADSLPTERLDELRRELAHLSEEQAATEYRRRVEALLDAGKGACRLSDPRIAVVVRDALDHFAGEHYDLHAWVLMPNHVHVLVTVHQGWNLGDIVKSWKTYTARQANHLLGNSGPFWQTDYFDRGIRTERQFYTVWSYIESNPSRAGLCERNSAWAWSSAYGREVEE